MLANISSTFSGVIITHPTLRSESLSISGIIGLGGSISFVVILTIGSTGIERNKEQLLNVSINITII